MLWICIWVTFSYCEDRYHCGCVYGFYEVPCLQGWLELASARHSMGASRISSSLFDLKLHSAATSLRVTEDDGKYVVDFF